MSVPTEPSKNQINITSSVYDKQNQLIREDNEAGGYTYVWTYDDAGNILDRKEYVYTTGTLGPVLDTVTYGYSNTTWGDLLTSYGGQSITYDTIGNPLSYYNGNRWTFNWENGRELATMTKAGVTWTNTYDANGMRTRRTNGTTYYEYVYDGSTLSQMRFGANVLDFIYGAEGTPLAVIYSGSYYYYVTNAQGDVVALLNSSGNTVVTYTYDAWGNPISTTGTMAAILGTLNPLRYRGYVYDTETGLYYLQSRYYDPEIGRWINADSVVAGVGGDVKGYNLFAYCFNNPINMSDSSGRWPQWIKAAVSWVNDNIFQPVVSFVKDVAEDIKNYDSNNQSEEKVLESNYFSSYKGVPVIRTNGDRSGSFGAIFLTRETNNRSNPEDVLRHEYGHTKQLEQLGVVNYALCIGLPSWQQWGTGEYYSKPWEITADIYGGVQSRNHSQSNIDRGFAYLEGSKIIGALIWVFIE